MVHAKIGGCAPLNRLAFFEPRYLCMNLLFRCSIFLLQNSTQPWANIYTPKNYDLFKVVENGMQQCCTAHIVHSCQQYCSALLSLNQPAIRLNNAEQHC